MDTNFFFFFAHRNHFLRKNKLNGSIIKQKEQSLNVIKFVGRQHLLLTDIMNDLNFCYSIKVFSIYQKLIFLTMKCCNFVRLRLWSTLLLHLCYLFWHSIHFINTIFIKMNSIKIIYSPYSNRLSCIWFQRWSSFIWQI